MRRIVAMTLLLSFYATSVEAVVGVVRDGTVHHETASEAMRHAESGPPEHGHEVETDAPGSEHGKDHQHGTGADHCTHAHGTAVLITAPRSSVQTEDVVNLIEVVASIADHHEPPLTHPPRI